MTNGPGSKGKNTSNLENLILTKVDLEQALSELKFIDQMFLLWRFWEGDQLEKIAERLDMNLGAVNMKQTRILAKLRSRMENK
jgi:DNA-directed RNA polymerase specialized sigma24 family protein